MLEQVNDILNTVLTSGSEESSEPMTVLEQLEQENSGNVTERHLLKSEYEYEKSGAIAQYGKSFAIGILVNSVIGYGLVSSIPGITLSFNPILYTFLIGGMNIGASVIGADKDRSPRANVLIGSSKFVVNMSVNGSLIYKMNEKKEASNKIVTGIRAEIDRYEAGYPKESTNWNHVSIVGIILILILIISRGVKK